MARKPAYLAYRLILIAALFFVGAKPIFGQSNDIFTQLVGASKSEVARKGGRLTIALEWTDPNEGKPVVEGFKRDFPYIKEAVYESLGSSAHESLQRMLMEYRVNRVPSFDIMYVSPEVLSEYRNAGLFVKPLFPYRDLINSLPAGWTIDSKLIDPEGYFIATTGVLGGILYSAAIVESGRAPKTWEDCLHPQWRGKFIYDPRPRLVALQHDAKTRGAHMKWLRGIVENKAVLIRGQTEALEKVASGEFPLFCGVRYHSAMKAIAAGAPLMFVLPDPFPVDLGTYLHVLKWSATPATTQLFALWLASKGQPLVEKYAYRGFPWLLNSSMHSLAKGKYAAICDLECLSNVPQYTTEHAAILKLPGSAR